MRATPLSPIRRTVRSREGIGLRACRAIFGSTDERLSAWLADQVHWFVKLAEKELLQRTGIIDSEDDFKGIRPSLDLAAAEAGVPQTNLRSVPKCTVGLLDLATIFRQVFNAASAFCRVHAYFFPVVAITFERYVVAVHRQRLEAIAAAFARVRLPILHHLRGDV